MTPAAQNKLLKTLEEPPANVHILMGATSEYGLLPTVLSRVRRLEIHPFPDRVLLSAMEGEFPRPRAAERSRVERGRYARQGGNALRR